MPHVVLRTSTDPEELARRFKPLYVEDPEATIKFLEAYQSLHDGKMLVEALVNEEPLKQHICLAVRRRESGDLIVELHGVGFPRPTAGIHRAIQKLADWIIVEYPATVVAHSNLMPRP